MGRRPKQVPFYVINSNFKGEIGKYDVMSYLVNAFDYKFKNKNKDKKPKTFKEVVDFVDYEAMYQFWSRCEYEIQVTDWPLGNDDSLMKIDVYWQMKMNIETIARLLIHNLALDIKDIYKN